MKEHLVVVDLGYGDAGKGTVVASLCQQVSDTAVIRFNGGAQAAHNVVTSAGQHHTFAQFGSGTFTPGVKTHLSSYTLLDIPAIFKENDHLHSLGITNALSRLSIGSRALIITPYMVLLNRALETKRGTQRHGSCGRGIGQTQEFSFTHPSQSIHAELLQQASASKASYTHLLHLLKYQEHFVNLQFPDLLLPDPDKIASDLVQLTTSLQVVNDLEQLNFLASTTKHLVFEGAQGALLDEDFGFHPYTTWSKTSSQNALSLIQASGIGKAFVLGVTRTYSTRHGPGPFPSQSNNYDHIDNDHNTKGLYQGDFRRGHLDLCALRYALTFCPVNALAVTHADVAQKHKIKVINQSSVPYAAQCQPRDLLARTSHSQKLENTHVSFLKTSPDWAYSSPELISQELKTPLYMLSSGPRTDQKTFFDLSKIK